MIGSRQIVMMLVAVALLIGIVLSWVKLRELGALDLELVAIDKILTEEDESNAIPEIAKLASNGALSPAQRKRLNEQMAKVFERSFQRSNPATLVGNVHARESGEYEISGRTAKVSIKIGEQELRPWVQDVRINSKSVPLQKNELLHDVVIPADATRFPIDIVILAALADETPIAVHTSRIMAVVDERAPTISVRVSEGGASRTLVNSDRSTISFGARVTVVASDARALERVQVRIGDALVENATPANEREWSFEIPPDYLEAQSDFVLKITATNDLAITESVVTLLVRPLDYLPIASASFGGRPLSRDDLLLAPSGDASFEAQLLPGETSEFLVLASEGRRVPLSDVGEGVLRAKLSVSSGKPVGIALFRGDRSLASYRVQIDDVAPSVSVTLDGESLSPGSPATIRPDSVIQLALKDATSLAWEDQNVSITGLKPGTASGEGTQSLSRPYTSNGDSTATMSVTTKDMLGNTSPAASFTFTIAEPLRATDLTLDGAPLTDGLRTRKAASQFAATLEGTIPAALRVEIEASGSKRTQEIPVSDGKAVAMIEWNVEDGESALRTLVLHGNEGEEVRLTLLVDRKAPTILFLDHLDENEFPVDAGTGLRIQVDDEDAVASVVLNGGTESTPRTVEGPRVVLTVTPTSVPGTLTVTAKDAAGNELVRSVTMTKPALPLPMITILRDGQTVAPGARLTLNALNSLVIQVKNGTLASLSVGGITGSIGPDGRLNAPASAPRVGDIQLVAKNADGQSTSATVGYELPLPVDDGIVSELGRLEALLAAGKKAEVRSALPDLGRRIASASSSETGYWRQRLTTLEQGATEVVQPTPPTELPSLPLTPTRTNAKDGATLVLVTSAGTSYYVYESEVTRAMFRQFYTEARKDPAFFANLSGIADVSAAKALFEELGTTSRLKPAWPMLGITPDLARAYAHWAASDSLGRGSLGIPTLEQWRTAASGGVADASYPLTEGDPDGRNLSNRDRGAVFDVFELRSVKSFPKSPNGFYDLAGSAWEWVIAGNQWQVIGGSFNSTRNDCRLDRPLGISETTERIRASTGLRLAFVPR